MPWDNNTGGGGRSGGGGPWGQAPGSGGGGGGGGPRRPGGGNTPNLEDILNRGRDRFQGGLPGGRWLVVGGALAVAAFWALNSVYTVSPQEVGVELLFGQPKPEFSQPGLHFRVWPIESVERVPITENQTRVGSTPAEGGGDGTEGLMLTGDQNIVNMAFSVFWRVAEPANYLFNVRAPDEMVRRAAESAMREVVGRRPAQDVFRSERADIDQEVQEITQAILDSYGAGITITSIQSGQAAPPSEVADAFQEVQRAEQDEDRFQEVARGDANTLLGEARGQAAQTREEAAAYRTRVVQEAEGEAARFLSIYEEYAQAPEVTRQRLFLETMEQVLGASQKVIMENNGSGGGVVPYLPLNELRPSTQAPGTAATTTGGNTNAAPAASAVAPVQGELAQ